MNHNQAAEFSHTPRAARRRGGQLAGGYTLLTTRLSVTLAYTRTYLTPEGQADLTSRVHCLSVVAAAL